MSNKENDSGSAHAVQNPIETASGENAGPTRGRTTFGTGMKVGIATVVLFLIAMFFIL